MKKKKDLYEGFGSGGEIPHTGTVKKVMDLYDKRSLKDSAGHCILNPKEAVMGAFEQAIKSKHKLKNEEGIFTSDLPEKIFRNI